MNKLKAYRFLMGKTQDRLAVETGIFQSKISKIENGYQDPKDEDRAKLASALGAKPEELFPGN